MQRFVSVRGDVTCADARGVVQTMGYYDYYWVRLSEGNTKTMGYHREEKRVDEERSVRLMHGAGMC